MIPPDEEIFEVEQRLALRRTQVRRHAREAGSRALQTLASPAALLGAAALGFLAARKSDHTKAAKATGLAGVLVSGTMWFIKAQYGSPVQLAQVLLERFQRWKRAPSSRGDMRT